MDNTEHTFPHQRLDAWHVCREARRRTYELLTDLPAGYGEDARQLRRSAGGALRLIAEGGDRWARGDKRRRFEAANGEVGETVSGLVALVEDEVLDPEVVDAIIGLWGRVGSMCYGLIKKHR